MKPLQKAYQQIQRIGSEFPQITHWYIYWRGKRISWRIFVEVHAIGEHEPYNAYVWIAPKLARRLSAVFSPKRIKVHLYRRRVLARSI